jgi:WD repeat-containing protein 23
MILFLFLMQSDVNMVCFVDEAGHLLYSGSDDNRCKVKAIHLTLKI